MLKYNREPKASIQEQQFIINKFGGGLNNSELDSLINDNQCVDCKNMCFDSDNIMKKRNGTEYFLKHNEDDYVLNNTYTVERKFFGGSLRYICKLFDFNILPMYDNNDITKIGITIFCNEETEAYKFGKIDLFLEDYSNFRYYDKDKNFCLMYDSNSNNTLLVINFDCKSTSLKIVDNNNIFTTYQKKYNDVISKEINSEPITFLSTQKFKLSLSVGEVMVEQEYDILICSTKKKLVIYDLNKEVIKDSIAINNTVSMARYNDVLFFVDGKNLISYYDKDLLFKSNGKDVIGFKKIVSDKKIYFNRNQKVIDYPYSSSEAELPGADRYFVLVSGRPTSEDTQASRDISLSEAFEYKTYADGIGEKLYKFDGEEFASENYVVFNEARRMLVTTDPSVFQGYIDDESDYPLRTYVPKPNNFLYGDTIIEDSVIYYEPCKNELEDVLAGENFLPNKPKQIYVYNGSLCIVGDSEGNNILFMSKQGNPYYFPASHTFPLESNGDEIVDIINFDGSLILGRHNDIWVLSGNGIYDNSNPYYIKKIDSHTGFMCNNCGALINNYYIYLGSDNKFYKMNTPTTYVEYLMTRPLTTDIDANKKPFKDNEHLINVSTCVYENEVWFTFYYDNNTSIIVVYSFNNMAFTYFEGIEASSIHNGKYGLLFGRKDGIISKYDKSVYNDLNNAICATYKTKRFTLDNPSNYKFFKQFRITTPSYGSESSDVNVKCYIDSAINSDKTVFILDKNGRFGLSEWGDKFSYNAFNLTNFIQLNYKGISIQYELTNCSFGQQMTLCDIQTLYTIRDVR